MKGDLIQHLFTTRKLSKQDIENLFDLTKKIENNPDYYSEFCKGRILGNLFFEPSTRTRLSFESAMLRLGGKILGFTSSRDSSATKGESIADTIRMVNHYADIAVVRHYMEGVGEIAKQFATIPIISGGTGTQEHPTQALLDLYSLKKEFDKIDGLNIGFLGDLKYGRTIPSLLYSLIKYDNVKINLISPKTLRIRSNVENRLNDAKSDYLVTENLHEVLETLDALYVTRIQKERFLDPIDYERLKNSYKITPDTLQDVKDHFIILHPLPRVDEIHYDVDKLKYSRYFEQAKNGVWVRMALILKLLGVE